jgi:hypothetical protein
MQRATQDFFGTREQATSYYSLSRMGDMYYSLFVHPEKNGVCCVELFVD